jgi:hypothetical protein
LGIDFLKVLNYSYSALILPVWSVVEALEGKWGSRGTIEQRRGMQYTRYEKYAEHK